MFRQHCGSAWAMFINRILQNVMRITFVLFEHVFFENTVVHSVS